MRLPQEFHFAATRIIMKGIIMKMRNLENADSGKKLAYLIPRFLTAEASTSSR